MIFYFLNNLFESGLFQLWNDLNRFILAWLLIRRLFLFDAWPVPCSACIALTSSARNFAICFFLIFCITVFLDASERFFMSCKYENFRVNSKYDSCESPTFGIRMAEMAPKRRQIIFSNFILLLTMLLAVACRQIVIL